jgi:ABC-type lipoprotein export system ATPase subunit
MSIETSLAIRIENVTKRYGDASSQITALDDVSFQIESGERVALLGKSGSGKSTLLNLIGGLDRPSSGSMTVNGRNLTTLTRRELADYRRDEVGFIFQSYNLMPSRTAVQNAELPLIFGGQSPRARRDAAVEVLETVGLGDRIHHRPVELSGGEQQRVAIARALVNRPKLLLADEPTGNLDTETAAHIVDLLTETATALGTTVLLVTHDEELAESFADRTLRLQDGALI